MGEEESDRLVTLKSVIVSRGPNEERTAIARLDSVNQLSLESLAGTLDGVAHFQLSNQFAPHPATLFFQQSGPMPRVRDCSSVRGDPQSAHFPTSWPNRCIAPRGSSAINADTAF